MVDEICVETRQDKCNRMVGKLLWEKEGEEPRGANTKEKAFKISINISGYCYKVYSEK